MVPIYCAAQIKMDAQLKMLTGFEVKARMSFKHLSEPT